jgi:hypothetical protein
MFNIVNDARTHPLRRQWNNFFRCAGPSLFALVVCLGTGACTSWHTVADMVMFGSVFYLVGTMVARDTSR